MKIDYFEFSSLVLTDEKLKKYMKRSDYKDFIECKHSLKPLNINLANKVAIAIKKWAISMGATHYAHWFFPLTEKFAEKQVSFLDYDEKKLFTSKFNGSCLIQGEADASSFPSGGSRMTFEARGYTVWDYSSPIFIKVDVDGNKVVYIPTAFCSFNGVALDEKTPLLRANSFINKELTALLNLLGYNTVKNVYCTLGIEQEYFLLDENLYKKRKDLFFTGRTLFGSKPVKEQETSHHYFCEINERVSSFMHDLDKELWSLGIMAKIQHNEVAPSQHEIVPLHCQVCITVDQNILLMNVMQKIAAKHNLKVLFHEKPFNFINGSGKHNNWSLQTDSGINLLDYTKVSQETFLLILTSIISAIDKHYDLLKLSTSSHSNDCRLGGNEAPPSIISVYLGDEMLSFFDDYIESEKHSIKNKEKLDFNLPSLSCVYKDRSDRNRTSPFAFTGNKFEFRMVGSSQNTAFCNTILATIVGNEIKNVNKILSESKDIKNDVRKIILDNIKNHSRIIFNGNNYHPSWQKEAEARGLINYDNCIDCYDRLLAEENVLLFSSNNILSKEEIEVRHNTFIKRYCNSILLEGKTMINMSKTKILPSINSYLNELLQGNINLKKSKVDNKEVYNKIKLHKSAIDKIEKYTTLLKENINGSKDKKGKELAIYCKNIILQDMQNLRSSFDEIEDDIPEKFKPFPNYDDLLYYN